MRDALSKWMTEYFLTSENFKGNIKQFERQKVFNLAWFFRNYLNDLYNRGEMSAIN